MRRSQPSRLWYVAASRQGVHQDAELIEGFLQYGIARCFPDGFVKFEIGFGYGQMVLCVDTFL